MIVLALGCASAPRGGSREAQFKGKSGQPGEAARKITEVELQEDIERFSTVFLDRINQEMQNIGKTVSPELRQVLLRQYVLYASSSLEIATGSIPEVNLLDMVTFVTLTTTTLQKHWIPKVYGQKGQGLLRAFKKSEEEIWALVDRVTTPQQQEIFWNLIHQWWRENPDQIRVEGIRLGDFSRKAGEVVAERNAEVNGLLSGLRGAVSVADQTLLLSNRMLFLAQRMPFLLRLQARLGSQEILSDSLVQVSSAEGLLAKLQGINPLIEKMTLLSQQTGMTIDQMEKLIETFRRAFPFEPDSTFGDKLDVADRITTKLLSLSEKLASIQSGKAVEPMVVARRQLNSVVWNIAFALLVVAGGIGMIVVVGHALVRRSALDKTVDRGAGKYQRGQKKRPEQPPNRAA